MGAVGPSFVFQVRVPFLAFDNNTLTSSSTTQLKVHDVELPNIKLEETSEGKYVAETRVTGQSIEEAELAGVLLVEELMRLLALGNDRFDIDLGSVRSERAEEATNTTSSSDAGVVITDYLFVAEHLGLKKIKGLATEAAALAKRASWTPRIRRALELNQAAICSVNDQVRFLILMTALEFLASSALGPNPTLIRENLGTNAAKFGEELSTLLDRWCLPKDAQERLRNSVFNAYEAPVKVRLSQYLGDILGSGYEMDEVGEWWKMRGKIAHGEAVAGELKASVSRLAGAVQAALKKEIGIA